MDPALYKAMEEWEKLMTDPNIREEYLARRKAILDEKAAVREAELRLKKAIKQSKEEGRLEARLEGRLEARLEGRLEGKSEIAKKMFEKGMDISLISEITGLSEEEIRNC